MLVHTQLTVEDMRRDYAIVRARLMGKAMHETGKPSPREIGPSASIAVLHVLAEVGPCGINFISEACGYKDERKSMRALIDAHLSRNFVASLSARLYAITETGRVALAAHEATI